MTDIIISSLLSKIYIGHQNGFEDKKENVTEKSFYVRARFETKIPLNVYYLKRTTPPLPVMGFPDDLQSKGFPM